MLTALSRDVDLAVNEARGAVGGHLPYPPAEIAAAVEWVGCHWEALRGARLLVTGATGLFGRWLLATLDEANRSLDLQITATLLSRDPIAFAARYPELAGLPGLAWCRGDVRDFTPPAGTYTHLIHGATDTQAAAWRDPFVAVDTVVAGTRRALNVAVERGVRRVLLLSSGAVYGPQPAELERIPEDWTGGGDPLDPRHAYGEAKRHAENLCVLAAERHGLEVVVGRGFAFVGPGLDLGGHFAIGNFIGDALAGRPIILRGDGTPVRSYLYTADLAAWLWVMLAHAPAGQAINIGSDQGIPVAELARRVADLIAPGIPVTILGQPGDGRRDRYVPAIDRARALGLAVWTPLDEAIRRTATWYRQSSLRP